MDPSGRFVRYEIEDEITMGLEDYNVFSDFVITEPEKANRVAERYRADLIVLIGIGELAGWREADSRAELGMASLSSLLWLSTGIGSWWIPDVAFPTNSQIEVAWIRPQMGANAGGRAGAATPPSDPRAQFKYREHLSTGEYKLSLWDRAKPWTCPLAYLTTLAVPPALVPLRDSQDVDRSLAHSALADINRELARRFRGGSLRSAGAPFLFRLEEPQNGDSVQEDGVHLHFQYVPEPGFGRQDLFGLSALSVHLGGEGLGDYRLLRTYADSELQAVNERIRSAQPIEENVKGLRPGLNLIRLVARSKLGGRWITNTVAIHRR